MGTPERSIVANRVAGIGPGSLRPVQTLSGCRFQTRWPMAGDRCRTKIPAR